MTADQGQPIAPAIGLALSGGGSRAIAFHLGCLSALNDLGILPRVNVLSTVSGGSVIGAMYAASNSPFSDFEATVRAMLSKGLVKPSFKVALTTAEGVKALLSSALAGSINLSYLALSRLLWLADVAAPWNLRHRFGIDQWVAPVRRFASRTTILRRALESELFSGLRLSDLQNPKRLLIINAAELRTGSAFYFTTRESGSWRLGRLASPDVPVAYAVAASAAYPLFLPAIDDLLPFDLRDGSRRMERVCLTDGGIYDNLGLAPLWPDRDPSISLNVRKLDAIICCRAGYGLRRDPPSQFMIARLRSAFATVHDRAQNAAAKRLFDLRASGQLANVLMPYLGQDDSRLAHRPPDLVTREDTFAYPTDFAAMSTDWINRLSRRGEQLTRAVIAEHAPDFLEAVTRPNGIV